MTSLTDIDPWLKPYTNHIAGRESYIDHKKRQLIGPKGSLEQFALGHLFFGLHQTKNGWVFREWAPNATKIYLVGDKTNWQDKPDFELKSIENGNWEIKLPLDALSHGDHYKLHVYWNGGEALRLPSYVNYAVQDDKTKEFSAVVWSPDISYKWSDANFQPPAEPPLIYEAHVGMAGEEPRVHGYKDFSDNMLPRIKKTGYNTVQLMAVAEHPYYGSFGYHVSNYFAPSSRFGTPDDFKQLINSAHQLGLRVIIDLVHSHAVKNEAEGLSRFDGSSTQYFHAGKRGDHSQWDSKVFDYGKPEVLHFLLSNCRYWLDEFHVDGFRFDGVTSMLYTHHGLAKDFTSYADYFDKNIDQDALAYLTFANELVHAVKPTAITIAEDMSGFPGLVGRSGLGFDYRLSMGVPDLWIKTLKEKRDEQWDLDNLLYELTAKRPEEKVISYAESHDQALVGDKTLAFRLMDKSMYEHMEIADNNLIVERGVALHKLIRLITAASNGGGYLNFMGNEFGHPEWIDFPREGNDWSYQHARRQWSLADNQALKYHQLAEFDKAMVELIKNIKEPCDYLRIDQTDRVISFMRGQFLLAFNFSPKQSFTDYAVPAKNGSYRIVLCSDDSRFGGQNRIDTKIDYKASDENLRLYLPARTGLVLQRSE